MNKIAITFVIVLLTLSVIIRLDYTQDSGKIINEETKQDNATAYIQEVNHYDSSFMLSNIKYIKDNTLSLKDNRLIAAIINGDVVQVKKLLNECEEDILYHYHFNNQEFKLPIVFIAIGSNNDELINTVLSHEKIDKNITANIMLYDKDGNAITTNISPLAYAVYINNITLAEILIKNGADVNKKLTGNRTAMFYVNSKAGLELLEKYGADINAVSVQGNTPLIHSIIRNNVFAAFEFIAKGSNPNQLNHANATPLTIAINNNNISMVKMLLANGADSNFFSPESYSPLMAAVANSDLQTFHLLLNMGADANAENKLGRTCIYYMQSFNEQWTIWRGMIEALADTININHQDINGDTVLHINPERYLLYKELKPDLNIQNKNGDTPLHHLVKKTKNPDMVKLFIKDGANIQIKNKANQTALDIAKLNNNQKIIAILENH